ncbi:DUF3857 domain-containing protein [Mucilaginibacter psychrotolerans]|uniref:DUF3857 domain-containing protein n=1 Tax=Mucilaginibacter psychrotolerans TaxID=1524096 RepID=A0A4Y8SIH7_9SPHI|nr:DUF3857 domain-containing protein [Mucilaginibacter psychrotolerans]TFF38460.1 DUF3857 domain-containing protein [Mucilaginibacter psychrotolerans]
MNKTLTLLLACLLAITVKAQTPPTTQPFGKVDVADLQLKACDFEKDANAMVLFDKADVFFDSQYQIVSNFHKRIKIFNTNGKGEGDIRIEYYSQDHAEYISGLQAQTINMVDGKPVITKVDKKQIFTEAVDKYSSALVFSFPNVQAGSVLEFKYTLTAANVGDFPDWYFQGHLPTRYSELKTTVPDLLYYKNLETRTQPWAVNKEEGSGTKIRAIANLPSIPDEPFMTSREDNCERLLFQLLSINIPGSYSRNFSDTWAKVGDNMMKSEDLGMQLGKKLVGEEVIIAKAKALKTLDEKVAYVFGEVKNAMKFSGTYDKYTTDGVGKAWEKKAGNSGEINMILCHLLKKSGVNVQPMLVSTRGHGRVNPAFPSSYKFNSVVAYIPIDTVTNYVLDATNKYNLYNMPPANVLNTFGLAMDKDAETYDMVFVANKKAVKYFAIVAAEIKPDSKATGSASLVSYGYRKVNTVQRYKTDGEKKYIDYMRSGDNGLKINSLKMEDMEVDTLPLKQTVDFSLDLTGSDENYIYFNPNVLGEAKTSPFLAANRFTDVDFGYLNSFMLVGQYKLPAGYKVESLPKSARMEMPDGSITFRRVMGEQGDAVSVRYQVDVKQTIYFKENYPEFQDFYKKMYEMLNEPIVLKKS